MAKKSVFSSRLVEVRTRNGWTAVQVAEWSGISPALLSHYECGRRTPNIKNLARLCTGLRISADWLIGVKGTPTQPPPPGQEE